MNAAPEDFYAAAEWVWRRFHTRWQGLEREDAVQTAVAQCVRYVDGYDPHRGMSMRSYLVMLCISAIRDMHKAANRESRGGGRRALSLDFYTATDEHLSDGIMQRRESQPVWVLESREVVEMVGAAIDSLPAREARVVRSRMTGLTLREVGSTESVTAERIRVIEQQAHDRLRRRLIPLRDS